MAPASSRMSGACSPVPTSTLGPVPTLLERDFNLPPLAELLAEVQHIRSLQPVAQALAVRHG